MIESVCMFTSLHLSYLTLKGTTVGGTGGAQGLCTEHSTRMVNVCSHHMHLQIPLLSIHYLCTMSLFFPNLAA